MGAGALERELLIVRTLVTKILQQIMTDEHICYEPTKTLYKTLKKIEINPKLQEYTILGGYVFDECSPSRADAYEFIFFWQSAYALSALLLYDALYTQFTKTGSSVEHLHSYLSLGQKFKDEWIKLNFVSYLEKLRKYRLYFLWSSFISPLIGLLISLLLNLIGDNIKNPLISQVFQVVAFGSLGSLIVSITIFIIVFISFFLLREFNKNILNDILND